jgi:hypothetical protein
MARGPECPGGLRGYLSAAPLQVNTLRAILPISQAFALKVLFHR